MNHTNVHIINHTHWDREWFLSAVYTTHWIPTLIDKLIELSASNPDFRYLFDGQTLVIEDLLQAYPEYLPKVQKLIADGNLTIGPYYCQPDWKLTCGESLMRNLEYGQKDTLRFGNYSDAGWLVDTFGHVSQSPQIHKAFGLNSVYVWRGMPKMEPYFTWVGADGTEIFGVDLFGGYRNLYGVTHAPDVALTRLTSEVDKLSPYYPTPDLPLFDGYDLEDNPEDPLTFYRNKFNGQLPANLTLQESTPSEFVDMIRTKLTDYPQLMGELNSGKYGATFPGTYCSRVYAKLSAHDCATAVYKFAEPLATLAYEHGRPYEADTYEGWSRSLLQNDVHDVICGVSIDQVHEKAQALYEKVFSEAQSDITASLRTILSDMAAGTYAVSTVAHPIQQPVWLGNVLYDVETAGVGVFPVKHQAETASEIEPISAYDFKNDHYAFTYSEGDGVKLNAERNVYLALYAEHGDTYSDETGDLLAKIPVAGAATHQQCGEQHKVTIAVKYETVDHQISADVTFTLNNTDTANVDIDLDSTGTEFRLELVVETEANAQVYAGMPFDVVKRDYAETDLLPRELDEVSTKIMMGQRELNEIRTYPFHGIVGIGTDDSSTCVYAKGIYAYRAYEEGRLAITLRRSVEWLTRPNLKDRTGDAGPFFYVPVARSERVVRHQLALAFKSEAPDTLAVQQSLAAFQAQPLIVEWAGNGDVSEKTLLSSAAQVSSMRVVDGKRVIRWVNPSAQATNGLRAKAIETTTSAPLAQTALNVDSVADLSILNAPEWRIGQSRSQPNAAQIAAVEAKADVSARAKADAEERLASASGRERYLAQHQVYVHHREQLEYLLSARLNTLKAELNGEVTDAYLYEADEVVVKIGWELNQLRIKRRIYDYVVAAV